MATPGFAEDEIALRILVATEQAVKNLELLNQKFDQTSQKAKKVKADVAGVGASASASADGVNKMGNAASTANTKVEKLGKGLWSFSNLARTALGTLEAMAIFLVSRFVGQAITKTIDSIKQLELAMYKLSIAEASLSKSGVDITPEDLSDIAKDIASTYSFVSQIDASKIVGQVALLTKDLKLTNDQIRELAMAIPALSRSTGESIDETTKAIAEGIAKNGRGLADQNVQVNAAIIQQKAIEEGLVASAEAYSKLTAEQKQYVDTAALVVLISEASNEAMQKQGQLTDSVTEKTGLASAAWEDYLTQLGVVFAPAIKAGLDILIGGLELLQKGLERGKAQYIEFVATIVAGQTAIRGYIEGNVKTWEEQVALFKQAKEEAMGLLEAHMNPPLPEDTPTGNLGVDDAILEDNQDLQDALEKLNNAILEAQIKLAQDMEDAAIDLGRKLVDIDIEYANKRADAWANYSSKVADINRDYNSRIEEINAAAQESAQKARNDELEREAKFQNDMQELKENFLMDLEDALHERDARQVLKLIKQYNLDKLQAEREHALQEESAQRDEALRQHKFQAERRAAERERRAKLAEAQIEYQDKLAQLARDEQAERDAAQLAYQRKQEDLQRAMHDRLELLAAGLVSEFNLTKNGLDAILRLYSQYYSGIAQMANALNLMLAGQANLLSSTLTSQTSLTGNHSPTIGGGQRFAEGGTMIANRPTNVVFGDDGIEAATFTPLDRKGQDVNKLFSNLSGASGDGMGGTIGLEILLSPDLEARIVSNSMNKTADIITQIRKSKG